MTRATSDVRPETARRELRYEGFPLEAVLARVHAAHGADVTITAADRVRRGGIGGFFAREVFQVTVVVEEPAGAVGPQALGRIGVFDDDRPVVLDDSIDPESGVDPDFDFDTDDIDPADVDGALALDTPPERDAADDEIWDLLARAALEPLAPSAGLDPVPAPVPAPGPAPVEVVEPIRSLGPIASTTLVPSNAPVPGLTLPDLDLAALVERFEPAWCAPALPAAGLIAVVGTRADALPTAGALATSLGLRPDDVVVATPPTDIVIPTADEATRLAARTRYGCCPLAVVVVELVPGREGHEWARVVLEGLRPEQVRLAVGAASLAAQQHRGIAAIGGVDVIDLLAATELAEPESVLDAPAPIGTIDGRAATPEMWAATVLASRMRHGAHRPLVESGSVVS